MCEAIYIAGKGKGAGPLVKACEQVFQWSGKKKVIVVVWHGEWKDDEEFWNEVVKEMKGATEDTDTLITFFGASIDEMLNQDGGDRLPLLFRLLGRDPDSRDGCCPITDFQRLGKAPIKYHPDAPDTRLILKVNKILGLVANE